jgi:hypothetical protein
MSQPADNAEDYPSVQTEHFVMRCLDVTIGSVALEVSGGYILAFEIRVLCERQNQSTINN